MSTSVESSLLAVLIALRVLSVSKAHNASYFIPSNNPNPKRGSWSTVRGPITDHFEEWLNANGYGEDDFAQRFFFEFGSYGGKNNDSHQLTRTPIIFYHGNEDGALAVPGNFTSGSTSQIEYFLSVGYTSAELYVTTWGTRDSSLSMTNDHSCAMMKRMRRFTLAVMEYTQSRWINLISHSMGVTIARKIVKGGRIAEDEGSGCDLGEPLTERVGVFIGITGANYGMCACEGLSLTDKTCSPINGFWPGDSCGTNELKCFSSHLVLPCKQENYSSLLWEMNHDGIREGQLVYSLWTKLTHMQTKENTTEQQHELLKPFEIYTEFTGPQPELRSGYSSNLLFGVLMIALIVISLFSIKLCYDRSKKYPGKDDYEEI